MSSIEPPRLSVRDREVLTLLTWGYTNQQVADELYVSVSAVKIYIVAAYLKIGVTRRTQAIVWGVRHGLSTTPFTASTAPPDATS